MAMRTAKAEPSGVIRRTREEQLQFLRFLAFLNIFIAHAERWKFFPYSASHCANAAVSFFFMLSGMVTAFSLAGRDVTLSADAEIRFLWKKVKKVYPLYLVTTLLTVIFSDIPLRLIACDYAAVRPLLIQLGKNLLLLQSWFPENAHSFNSVGWFLSALMFLYACSLPAAWLLNRLAGGKRWYLTLPAAFVGVSFLVVAYCYLTQKDMSYWHYQFPPARLGEYLMGMIIGYLVVTLKPRKPEGTVWRWLFTAAEVFVIVFWYLCLSRPGNYWRNHNVSWLAPNTLLLTVFAVGGGWVSELFRRRPLTYLGDISFECYLVHQIIITRLAVNTMELPPSDVGNVFCFLFSLLLSVLVAWLLHRKKSPGAKNVKTGVFN